MRSELSEYGRHFSPDMLFERFVHTVADIPDSLSDIRFRSQHRFFLHRDPLMADFVGRFERLAEYWNERSQRFDLPPLPHHNRSNRGD